MSQQTFRSLVRSRQLLGETRVDDFALTRFLATNPNTETAFQVALNVWVEPMLRALPTRDDANHIVWQIGAVPAMRNLRSRQPDGSDMCYQDTRLYKDLYRWATEWKQRQGKNSKVRSDVGPISPDGCIYVLTMADPGNTAQPDDAETELPEKSPEYEPSLTTLEKRHQAPDGSLRRSYMVPSLVVECKGLTTALQDVVCQGLAYLIVSHEACGTWKGALIRGHSFGIVFALSNSVFAIRSPHGHTRTDSDDIEVLTLTEYLDAHTTLPDSFGEWHGEPNREACMGFEALAMEAIEQVIDLPMRTPIPRLPPVHEELRRRLEQLCDDRLIELDKEAAHKRIIGVMRRVIREYFEAIAKDATGSGGKKGGGGSGGPSGDGGGQGGGGGPEGAKVAQDGDDRKEINDGKQEGTPASSTILTMPSAMVEQQAKALESVVLDDISELSPGSDMAGTSRPLSNVDNVDSPDHAFRDIDFPMSDADDYPSDRSEIEDEMRWPPGFGSSGLDTREGWCKDEYDLRRHRKEADKMRYLMNRAVLERRGVYIVQLPADLFDLYAATASDTWDQRFYNGGLVEPNPSRHFGSDHDFQDTDLPWIDIGYYPNDYDDEPEPEPEPEGLHFHQVPWILTAYEGKTRSR